MASLIPQYAFLSGEVAPGLQGRSDLEKYDFGLASALNVFSDYRGGLANRPGTMFLGPLLTFNGAFRLVPFVLSESVGNSYVLVFARDRVWFVQGEGFVLEAAQPILEIDGNAPKRFRVAGHGYSDDNLIFTNGLGDFPSLNKRIFRIDVTSANHFRLHDVNLVPVGAEGTYTGGGTVRRLFSIPHPYNTADLATLSFHQAKEELVLTHTGYPDHVLRRMSHTNWSLTKENRGPTLTSPTKPTATASATGPAGTSFALVAVGANGEHSIESRRELLLSTVNYTTAPGSVRLEWQPVDGASHYQVFASRVSSDAANVLYSNEIGYIGTAFGPHFVDDNIIRDFTVTPNQFQDPFAPSAIIEVRMTNQGSGYSKNDSVTVTDGAGSGFSGFPIVDGAGKVVGVFIRRGGRDYQSPAISFDSATGTGAAANLIRSPAQGLFPGTATTFQQRRLFGGSLTFPARLWASRPGFPRDFSTTIAGAADDAFVLDIDDLSVSPIRHMLPMQAGLVVFTDRTVWMIRGEGRAVTPETAFIDPQTYKGAATLAPLTIDTDILYLQRGSTVVRSMSYNFVNQLFIGTDRSILSNHLFRADIPIQRWAYTAEPHSLVRAVRADGTALCFTFVKELDAFGWTRYETRGRYRDVVSVPVDGRDLTYFAVRRAGTIYLELEAPRDFDHLEDAWFVDSGLARNLPEPEARLTVGGLAGEVTLTADAAVFGAADEGKHVFAGGARLIVTDFQTPTQVQALFLRSFSTFTPEEQDFRTFASGTWQMAKPVMEVDGLEHLEGQTVAILADGSPHHPQPVVEGKVPLATKAVKVVVGLPFQAEARILPLTAAGAVIEGRRKAVVGANVRLDRSAGVEVGPSLEELAPLAETDLPVFDLSRPLGSGVHSRLLPGSYRHDGEFLVAQRQPLPMAVTQVVLEVDLGDDKR